MSNVSMENQQKNSYLFGGNANYIEALYEQYLNNPQTVSPSWRAYFESLLNGGQDRSHAPIKDYFLQLAKADRSSSVSSGVSVEAVKAAAVAELIHAYRRDGHYLAETDPLKLALPENRADLTLDFYDLTTADLERQFSIPDFYAGQKMSLKTILQALKSIYSSSIGIEYQYIANAQERLWIQNQFEQPLPQQKFSTAQKKRILQKLTAAEGLEKYLGSKYVGQKRFSLEGGEVFVPMLDQLIQQSGDRYPIKEIAIGMAHRGRLNVLVNIIGKSSRALFDAFEGKVNDPRANDVKYHLGAAADIPTEKGGVHVTLAFNPSHLEIINPVVEGSVRARQIRRKDERGSEVVPVLIHGDAAFAGQGVVMETLALSQTRGYYTGGTIHIVLNNQVGFTTDPRDARSSFYCTDVAKMIDAPVFHVNGDDPEAVLFVTQVALDYRMAFKKDVVIDLICFRRHGHNEADEPAATQPLMYQVIKAHPGIRKLYAEQLIQQQILDAAEAEALVDAYRDALDAGKELVSQCKKSHPVSPWKQYLDKSWREPTPHISIDALKQICQSLEKFPQELVLQPQVARVMEERRNMLKGELPLNWGCAEALAFARLLSEGFSIRLSGQDCQRGTFAHRHAVLHNYQTDETYTPLAHVSADQASFTAINSVLSEEAVLGYEYGFASADSQTLVIWEAQYGDFANGAQVVIDQFISSGEKKWGRLCGLVMFLPHGYEGSGPEHSSARLERYLQLCAEQNMQVCIPTTPAQIFHLLCRQMLRAYRKPLIVMTPKSFLRHKLVISSLSDLTQGEFQLLIPDPENPPSKKIKRIVLCSGKVYYDLLERQRTEGRQDIAIIRIEQLYPFPTEELTTLLASYTHTTDIVWCQEEPKNQGAWYSTQHRIQACLAKNQTLNYIGRPASASPAAGYMSKHLEQQNAFLNEIYS